MNTDNRATDELINNWQQVNAEVAEACKQSRRHIDDVKLLAVSKTKPVERIKALAQRGQRDFGENYLQEALEKITQLRAEAEAAGEAEHLNSAKWRGTKSPSFTK